MSTRLCQYENNSAKCKNWVTSTDEDVIFCPLHAGVLKRELSPAELQEKQRFDNHYSIADMMSDEQLAAHILQLENLLADVKLRQQAAASVKSKRIKAIAQNGQLSESQKAEIATLRGEKAKSVQEPKLSKEEKAIQKMMKLGFTRDKAIIMLGFDE